MWCFERGWCWVSGDLSGHAWCPVEQTRACPDGSPGEGSKTTQLKSGSGCGISGWAYPDYPRVCHIEERQTGGPCVLCAVSGHASTQATLWLQRKDNETFQGENQPEPTRLTWRLPPSCSGHSDGHLMCIERHRYCGSSLQTRILRNREVV